MPIIYNEDIMQRVKDHDFEASQIIPSYRIVGTFLQGSQNYNLGYEGSDVDTKCIVLPSFVDICLKKQEISYTHIRENNEHIDLKDMRLMLNCYRKQNINFIETLFIPYCIINPDYKPFWDILKENREKIAHADKKCFVKSTVGQCKEKYKACFLPRPSQEEEVKKYGWSTKNLHHLLRLVEFLFRYLDGVPYKDCLIPKKRDMLLEMKARGHEIYTLDDAYKMANHAICLADDLEEKFLSSLPDNYKADEEVEQMFDTVAIKIFEKFFKKELKD